MGMTNNEKQAAWRARQAENKRRVVELEKQVADLKKKLGDTTVSNQHKAATVSNQMVPPAIGRKIEEHLEALFKEGLKHMATMSPQTVVAETVKLNRLLVDINVVPPSRRASDSVAYAESIKRKWVTQEKNAWDAYQAKVDAARLETSAEGKRLDEIQDKVQGLLTKANGRPDDGTSLDIGTALLEARDIIWKRVGPRKPRQTPHGHKKARAASWSKWVDGWKWEGRGFIMVFLSVHADNFIKQARQAKAG